MRNYSDITLKYLKKNKKRTLFTIIGIILSLSLISGVGFLGLSFKDYMYNSTMANNGNYEFSFGEVSSENINILKNDVDLEKVGVYGYSSYSSYTLEDRSENTIYFDAEDEVYMNEVVSHELSEGRFPKNNSELMINSKAKEILGINIGDEVNLRERQYDEEKEQMVSTNNYVKYTVVGFIKEQYETGDETFSATTILDKLDSNNSYRVFFSVVNKKGKMDLVEEKLQKLGLSSESMDVNNQLLALKGETSYEGINVVIKYIVIFVLLIIVLATIFLIYNAINISVTERMTQFGILRSIGASPKQVSNLVLREGLIMCLISIPFGVIAGFLGVWITVKLLDTQIQGMFGQGMLVVKFYPIIILFTSILGIITILIASYGPAMKAGKVSPINIVKGNSNEEKIKYYNGKIIRKTFGVEGWIAYKNIRKNSMRFVVTILSLSISLIMFITFSTLNMKRLEELDYIKKSTLIHGTVDTYEYVDEVEEEIKAIDGIGEVYRQIRRPVPFLAIDMDLLTDEYKEKGFYNTGDKYLTNLDFEAYSNNAFKEMGVEEGLKDNEVIIVNDFASYDDEGKLNNIPITTLKEGDKFKVPVSNFKSMEEEKDFNQLLIDKENNNCVEFTVKKVISKNPFKSGYSNVFMLIMNYDKYNELAKGEDLRDSVCFRYSNINNDKLTKSATKEVQKIADKYSLNFNGITEDSKREEQMWTVINVFIYGFIVMVTLIGVVNVVNTISLNILLKKKEFGTLGTIGMGREQLTKMVLLEGLLHGIISSIIGGILSVGLVLVAVRIMGFGFSFGSKLYWQPFVIGFAINLVVVFIASLIPLNKLKKMSLVETIRNVE